MEIITWFRESVMGNTLMVVFLVAFIGYLVGSIKIDFGMDLSVFQLVF